MPRGADAQPECIHHIFIFLRHRPECARTPHPAFYCLPRTRLSPNFSSFLKVRQRTVLQCASPCCSFVLRNSRWVWCSAGWKARVLFAVFVGSVFPDFVCSSNRHRKKLGCCGDSWPLLAWQTAVAAHEARKISKYKCRLLRVQDGDLGSTKLRRPGVWGSKSGYW